MPIPENFIQELAERSDIVDVVGGYVNLSKKSGANLFGLCPFHNEKTPSFSVSPDKQIYHCFGCGKGGGVFSFIMEMENLSFPEAVEFLAKRAGMAMPEETEDTGSRERARMYDLNRDAARYFYEQLSTPAGESARAYMARRRIGGTTARNFGLGFAPDSWDGLRSAMKARGYTDHELFAAGLVRRGKRGGFYDTFRNRLMFPVIDVRGNVIGFSGRILGDGEPKYMNSPETAVFNKSRCLFALNLAKKSKSGYIILVEGNIDVASLHQAGFDSAVASLGTSLTPEQARLISRYTDTVVLAYDNDAAGHKAAQRAIGILGKLDLKVKVLALSGAKDPDEFIQTRGPEAFRKLLEGADNQIDYQIDTLARDFDLSEAEQKIEFLSKAYSVVVPLSAAAREVYADKLAKMVGVRKEAVYREIENRRERFFRKTRQAEQKELSRTGLHGPRKKGTDYSDPVSAMAEEGLIRLLYTDPELIARGGLPPEEDFSSDMLRHIYAEIRRRIESGRSAEIQFLTERLTPEEMSLLVGILDQPVGRANREQALSDYINKIQTQRDRRRPVQGQDLLAKSDELRKRKGYKGE